MNDSTITSLEERKEMIIEVHEDLELHPECCIFRVPEVLRKMNEDAYTPQVISIGPLHHGIDKFNDMEKQKIRYKREFKKRITIEKWRELINFIEDNEGRIRNYYSEKPKLEKFEFVIMILYDAIFIIEMILKSAYGHDSDFLLDTPYTNFVIRTDLQVLENQLPFFVLNGLHKLAFPSSSHSFIYLSSQFFKFTNIDEIPVQVEEEVKHFTDLARYFTTKNYPKSESPKYIANLPCAVKLQESGVKFTRVEGECLLDIRFVKKKLWWFPFFKVDELQIPFTLIDDHSECFFRNVMALEQYYYPQEDPVCNYVDLMDMLIDTEEDVNLLVEAGIICNIVGDSARIATMFNNLGRHIWFGPSHYTDIFDGLQAHYHNPWNRAKATLKRVYFNDLWRSTATAAAIMLLLLTLIQTICSVS